MQRIRLNLSDEVYDKAHQAAQDRGKDLPDYLVDVLEDHLGVDRSFLHKSGIHRCLRGDSIINNGNLVRLNGIYHNYRLQGEKTDGRVKEIHPNTTYQVSDFDGNVAILRPIEP